MDARDIAEGLSAKMKLAILDLRPTLEWQDQPRHKGNHSSSLCYVQKRTIGQDCYAELGNTGSITNTERTKRSDPYYKHRWRFTKLGLAVRQHLEVKP